MTTTTQTRDEERAAMPFKLAVLMCHYANTTPRPSAATINKFQPIIDAAASASTSTQWTGESALRIFSDVCRDMRLLVTRERVLHHVPKGIEMQAMAGIPARLAMAVSYIVAEALPAIHHGTLNKENADLMIKGHQIFINEVVYRALMHAHESVQSEAGQIEELELWGAQRGVLIDSVILTACLLDDVCSTTMLFAPTSNHQAALMALEARAHLDELKATLQRCATA